MLFRLLLSVRPRKHIPFFNSFASLKILKPKILKDLHNFTSLLKRIFIRVSRSQVELLKNRLKCNLMLSDKEPI